MKTLNFRKRNLLYILLVAVISSCNFYQDREIEDIEDKYCGGIILQKEFQITSGGAVSGHMGDGSIVIKYNGQSKQVRTWQLYYEKYNVGDTINCH
jgi:hypothetical protein